MPPTLLFTVLFCVFFVLCWGFFFEHMCCFLDSQSLASRACPAIPGCINLVYTHRLLSNLVFVSEIGIVTTSQAITHYVLALKLIRRLHRELL